MHPIDAKESEASESGLEAWEVDVTEVFTIFLSDSTLAIVPAVLGASPGKNGNA